MARYEFEYEVIEHGAIAVEADSEEEAVEKFKRKFQESEMGELGSYELVNTDET